MLRRRLLLKDNGHEYVEIGGLKWATMNIGANNITDYGLYFQWGDTKGYTAEQVGNTSGKKNFGWIDYKYGNGTSSPGEAGMAKYNATDGKTVLEASDDAAVANWGGSWRMPTCDEFLALGAAVNTAWTKVNNVSGLLCIDKTDSSKTLFFPAAGFCKDYNFWTSVCFYWSSSIGTYSRTTARYLNSSGNNPYWGSSDDRYWGLAVRPVIG